MRFQRLARPEAAPVRLGFGATRLRAMRRWPKSERRGPSILIVALIVAAGLLWYASLRGAASSRGVVNLGAKALFLILTCLACIAIGFFLPMLPVVSAMIGSAFWAGLLATAGALAGVGLSDAILTRIEAAPFGATTDDGRTAHAKTRPPV